MELPMVGRGEVLEFDLSVREVDAASETTCCPQLADLMSPKKTTLTTTMV